MDNLKDDEMLTKSWQKVYETATKAGYRDGIAAGRDSVYQKSFDIGYSKGLQNGFALGQCKSLLSANQNFNFEDDLLQKTTRGNCEICKNNDLLNKSISDMINLQLNSTKNLLEVLDNKYSQKLEINLPSLK